MPISIDNNGTGNIINITEHNIAFGSGHIELHGNDNRITIGDAMAWGQCRIVMLGGAIVDIGRHCVFSRLSVYAGAMSTIRIGTNVGFSGATSLTCHEPARLIVGNDCLFASETDVSTSDMHSILDASTGLRVNPSSDVEIGDKVWIGYRSIVLKGSRIGANTVVGAGSVVAGTLEPGCIAAGVPARVIRRGVTWERELISTATQPELNVRQSRWNRLKNRVGLR